MIIQPDLPDGHHLGILGHGQKLLPAGFPIACLTALLGVHTHSGVKTLLLAASDAFRQVSSSFLKERLIAGESVGDLLPQGVEEPFLNMLLQRL